MFQNGDHHTGAIWHAAVLENHMLESLKAIITAESSRMLRISSRNVKPVRTFYRHPTPSGSITDDRWMLPLIWRFFAHNHSTFRFTLSSPDPRTSFQSFMNVRLFARHFVAYYAVVYWLSWHTTVRSHCRVTTQKSNLRVLELRRMLPFLLLATAFNNSKSITLAIICRYFAYSYSC
jgi:hypothetical protein